MSKVEILICFCNTFITPYNYYSCAYLNLAPTVQYDGQSGQYSKDWYLYFDKVNTEYYVRYSYKNYKYSFDL